VVVEVDAEVAIEELATVDVVVPPRVLVLDVLVVVVLDCPVQYPIWNVIAHGPWYPGPQDAPELLEVRVSNPNGVPWSFPWGPYLVQ